MTMLLIAVVTISTNFLATELDLVSFWFKGKRPFER